MNLPSNAAGRVLAVSISDRKGIKKRNVNAAELLVEHGLYQLQIFSFVVPAPGMGVI
jgi:hypothetical protein